MVTGLRSGSANGSAASVHSCPSTLLMTHRLRLRRTVVEFARHWCHWGDWWIEERVTRAEDLLPGGLPPALAACRYRWLF